MSKEEVISILENDLRVSRETIKSIENYHDLVLKWNNKINLIGKSTETDFWTVHVLDSVQLIKYLPNKDIVITDFGSGAGFPGIILSLAGYNLELIEMDTRKAAFLHTAANLSNKNMRIFNDDIKNINPWKANYITSRALADLTKLFNFIENFISLDTKVFAWKGKSVTMEIELANAEWGFDYIKHSSMASSTSCILEISNIKRNKT
jgi:16S rRNA (guanine527-N7)-methyltransferase